MPRVISRHALLALFLFLFNLHASALPFALPQFFALEHIVKRAPYSVVAVDGGSGSNLASYPTSTSPAEESTNAAAVTKTVIETEMQSLPPSTDVVISTQIIDAPGSTETIVVTITAPGSESTVLAAHYSVIDVASPVAKAIQSSSVLPSSSTSMTSPQLSVSISLSSSSSLTTSSSATTPISSADSSPSETEDDPVYSAHKINLSSSTQSTTSLPTSKFIPMDSYTATSKAAYPTPPARLAFDDGEWHTTTSNSTTTTTTTTTHSSYDDGQWHTIYPAWADTTSTGEASLKARHTPTLVRHHRVPSAEERIVR